MREILHQYQQDERMAKVFLTPNGFEVDLFDKNGLRETRELHNHSEKYAEDCAENYVLGLFSV
tara:strand:- start:315 stop:503 length:189 start_codon:yes stop_codon:yes gene_type:complete